MWRIRCTALRCSNSGMTTAMRLQWLPYSSRFGPATYGLVVPCTSTATSFLSSGVVPTSAGAAITEARRYFRAQGRPAATETPEEQAKPQEGAADQTGNKQQAEGEAGASGEGAKTGDEKAKVEEELPKGFRGQLKAIKRDYVEFPDIYNSANGINFILFTVFCLCSTGSNVEAEWWIQQFGVDAAFRPLAWFMHSVVMNNFLSMTFAMMLMHSMCHSVLPTIGSAALFQYCAIVSVVAGFLMWAGNAAVGYTGEKQFGPWDVVAALFVMQFLHQGFLPWQILNSFNGWVRYACWVGAVCILYFDPQPTATGAALGFALCRFHPRFRAGAAAAAK